MGPYPPLLQSQVTGLTTSDSPQFAGVNVGHASDTTLERSAAGKLKVEGVDIPTISSTDTLTNKTLVLAINTQTDSYTLVAGDASKLVQMNKGTANTLTVPKNSSVAFATGTQILIEQLGAGLTTVSPVDGDVTINSRGTALKMGGQYATAVLIKTATDRWNLSGDITA